MISAVLINGYDITVKMLLFLGGLEGYIYVSIQITQSFHPHSPSVTEK